MITSGCGHAGGGGDTLSLSSSSCPTLNKSDRLLLIGATSGSLRTLRVITLAWLCRTHICFIWPPCVLKCSWQKEHGSWFKNDRSGMTVSDSNSNRNLLILTCNRGYVSCEEQCACHMCMFGVAENWGRVQVLIELSP